MADEKNNQKEEKKENPRKHELPLGEDYQEAGHKFEYESDKARADARVAAAKGKEEAKKSAQKQARHN